MSNRRKGLRRENRGSMHLLEAEVKNRDRQVETSRSPKNRDLRGEKWRDPRAGELSGNGRIPPERRSQNKRESVNQETPNV